MRCQASWSWSSASGGASTRCGCALGHVARQLGLGLRRDRCRPLLQRRRGRCRACEPLLELVEAERHRLPGEVATGPCHLDEGQLERQPRITALAVVVHSHREQVAQPQHRRLRELIRLLAKPVARLVGDGQRIGNLAHVLDEKQVAQMLEQIGDEAREILPLLGKLLDEDERTRGVAVDDGIADAEERLLFDGAE